MESNGFGAGGRQLAASSDEIEARIIATSISSFGYFLLDYIFDRHKPHFIKIRSANKHIQQDEPHRRDSVVFAEPVWRIYYYISSTLSIRLI